MSRLQTPRTRRSTLVGRDGEVATLRRLFDQVADGGSALVIRGEPGIGKSALLAEAGEVAAEQGMQVLWTTGTRSEAKVPFAGLHQLLRPVLNGVDHLPPAQRDAVHAAFGMSDIPVPDLFRIALAALDLLADSAAGRPLLLVAEDAHWLDQSTVDVLAFIGRRLDSDPIVLLVATRDGPEGVLDKAGLRELAVRRLSDDAAARLLDIHAPDLAPSTRARLLGYAVGNPLALVELPIAARLDQDDLASPWLPLTDRLKRTFAARAADLPHVSRVLLLAAALNDGDVVSESLGAVSFSVGTDVSLDALAPSVDAGLVVLDGGKLRFRHPLVASAIYQSAGLGERHGMHAAFAHVLEDQPDRAVWHRAASTLGPDAELAEELEAAATRAERRGALAAAAAGLETAARLTPPGREGQLLLRAAGLALELGRRETVTRLVKEAEALELSQLDLGRLAWIVETLDPGITGDPATVFALVDAADQVASRGDQDLALALLSAAASNSYWANRSEETHDQIVASAERLRIEPNDPRLLLILAQAAPPDSVPALVDRLRQWRPDRSVESTAMQQLGTAAFMLGVHELAIDFLSAAIDSLRDQGRLVQLAQSLVMRSWSAINLDRWTVAATDAEEGARLAHETAQPIWEAGAHVAQALLAGVRGDEAAAYALAGRAESVVLPAGGRAVVAVVQLTRGLTALGAGDYEAAHGHLLPMLDPAALAHHRMNFYWAIGDLAEAAVRIGERDSALATVEALEPRLANTPSPVFHEVMRHARALLAEDDQAEALFAAALDAETMRGPFERGRLQLAYGAWLRRQRRIAESRPPLRAARDTFDALGAIPWGERAREELRAAGEASNARRPGLLEQLTPQELQVAQMAAEGLSNREIGQKLYLSHRTVGSHLYRIFPKLGITKRSELAATLESDLSRVV